MTKLWKQVWEGKHHTEAKISEEWFEHESGIAGERVVQPFPLVTLKIKSTRRPPADFFMPGTLFTVSEKLRAVLEEPEFQVGAEFFPLRILFQYQEYTAQRFYYCNILDVVDCFDHERGEYTYFQKPGFTDHVDSIKNLVIDEEKTKGHDLFRIANGGEYLICASDRLAARIEAAGLTGMRFSEPSEWNLC